MSGLAQVPAYRIRITLRDVKPAVLRRLVLPGFWDLGKVHAAVQAAVGWSGGHLHEFTSGDQRWGQPTPAWTSVMGSCGRSGPGCTRSCTPLATSSAT